MADGCIAVIGHDREEKQLWGCRPREEIELGHAASIGDGVPLWHQTLQGLGHGGGGTDDIHVSQIKQKKVHGSVEPRVAGDGQDDKDITYDSHRIEGEETDK